MNSDLTLDRVVWTGTLLALLGLASTFLGHEFWWQAMDGVDLYALFTALGGSGAALWTRYTRGPKPGRVRLLGAFVLGALVALLLVNPYTLYFGFGLIVLACLPVGILIGLVMSFRPMVLGSAPLAGAA